MATNNRTRENQELSATDPGRLRALSEDRLPDQRIILQFGPHYIYIAGYGAGYTDCIAKNYSNLSFKGLQDYCVLRAKSGDIAPITLRNNLQKLNRISFLYPSSEITEFEVIAASCTRDSRDIWDLKNFLISWYKLGLPGVTQGAALALANLPPAPKCRPAGSPVRSDNPNEGYYEQEDYESLVSAYWDEYDNGEASLSETTCRLLIAQYGRRPVQLASLKIGDITDEGEFGGVAGRRIEFPGAKKADDGSFRSGLIEAQPMGDDLWDLCQLLIVEVDIVWNHFLGRKLTEKELKSLPLFQSYNWYFFKKRWNEAFLYHGSTISELFNSEYLHINASFITKLAQRRKLKPLKSVVTNDVLIEGAQRMRYTRVRQLLRMGVSREAIRHWLAHKHYGSTRIYGEDLGEEARIINEAVAPLMSPLVQAFNGTLRDRESDATRGDDPSSRIEIDGKNAVGSCGQYSYCDATVPIPCYRCKNFEPWVYAPHDEVLDRLIVRQRMEDAAFERGSPKRLLAPINLARDIVAVRSVIAACNARKKLLEGDDND
ncbi:hypothetical protein [Pseudomonas prosekii]|uniref:hypothetical protein n=1 Tax=Pseudomonas prosekii TaxID=1148509 RepID=UPI0011EA851E|nr:hypothetical protein [Pseudomonas prosekii]